MILMNVWQSTITMDMNLMNELKTYNVKVVNKMAVGVWPREEVKSEYKSLSYNQALSIKEIWSNAKDYNVVIKENGE